MKTARYKVKKRYGLKGLADGWYIYSRHIMPGKGRGLEFKRQRVSGPFSTRKKAVMNAEEMEKKSRVIVLNMIRI